MKILVRITVRSLVVLCLLLSVAGAAARAETTQFAYGANAADWSLTQYRVNPETGALRHNGHLPAIKFPAALAVHPSKRFLVTVIKTINAIAVHRIDADTGHLLEIPQSPFSVDAQSPYSVSIHPSGRFVYVAARWGGVVAFTMDEQSGVLTLVPGSPFAAQKRTRSVQVHPSGRFVYATNAHSNSISAYRVDEKTGVLTPVEGSPFSTGAQMVVDPIAWRIQDAPPESGGAPFRVEVHPSGRFIFVTNSMGLSFSVFRVDADSGALTPLKDSPIRTGGGQRPYAVSVHPSGRFVYVSSWNNQKLWAYGFDEDSGQLNPLSTPSFSVQGYGPINIDFNAQGTRAYVTNVGSNSITQFSVDARTGELSLDETVRTRYQPFDLALLDGEPVNVDEPFSFIIEEEKDRLRILRADAVETTRASQDSLENKKSSNSAAYAAVAGARGQFVYKAFKDVDKPDKSGIAVYRIDPLNGSLTFLPEYNFALGFAPTQLAMATGGRFLYAINSSINSLGVFTVDSESGALGLPEDEMPKTGKGPAAIALDPVGRFSFVANASDDSVSVFTHRRIFSAAMYPINKEGSAFPAGDNPVALSVDPTGKFLFVANKDSNDISAYTIHHHEGKLKAVKGSPFAGGVAPVSIVTHPTGKFAYVVNADSADIVTYKIDSVTGELDELPQRVAAGKQPESIVLDPEGRVAYVRNKATNVLRKYKVDAISGQLTFAAEIDFGQRVTVVN